MMRRMKKLLAALLAVSLLGTCGAAIAANRLEKIKSAGKLVVATEPYFPPWEFLDNTKTGQEAIRGCDIELAKYIADKMGVELVLMPLSFEAVLAGIAQGKYDLAISGIAYTPRRGMSLELSTPYETESSENNGYGLLVRKADENKYTSFADFDGLPVGYHSGTLQQELVETQLPKAVHRVFDTLQNAVLALEADKIEAVGVSVTNGSLFAAANPNLVVLPMRFVMDKDGTCVAATKGEVELIECVNKIIDEVNEKKLFVGWQEAAAAEAAKLGLK